jgi:hypothetical protein
MARIGGIAVLALAAAAGVALLALRALRPPDAPMTGSGVSVLLIVVDTLRADALGVYGADPSNTPRLDEFARGAAVFEHAVASGPMTLVSFASLLTGMYLPANRVSYASTQHSALDERHVTLAEALQGAGYRTAAFVGGGFLRPHFNFDQGFETYGFRTRETRDIRGAIVAADEWLEGIGDRPFFLMVHGMDPHRPYRPEVLPEPEPGYRPPDRDFAAGVLKHLEEGGSLDDYTPGELRIAVQTVEEDQRGVIKDLFKAMVRQEAALPELYNRRWAESPGYPQQLGWLRALYDAEVREADRDVGAFLDRLAERGKLDDTLVVFTADHGDAFMEHLTMGHRRAGQAELHVPLILRPPPARGAEAAPRVAQVVRGIDLMPTMLDYAGVDPPPQVQGRSLRPLVEGASLPPLPAAAFGGTRVPEDAIREGRYKLIHRARARSAEFGDRLYDLESDPREQRDLKDEEPELFARLQAELEATRAQSLQLGAAYGAVSELSPEDVESLRQLGYIADDDTAR